MGALVIQSMLNFATDDEPRVERIPSSDAAYYLERAHYLGRMPSVSYAFGLWRGGDLEGVCTFGIPPSRHLQKSACPSDPSRVIEFNRLWVHDRMPRNTESWFVSRAIKAMPPRIVVSYADTAVGHVGYIYRALNFFYAGLTDADRRTPRFDYVVPGKHSRDAFRSGEYTRVRRKPKHKYWTVTGSRRDRRELLALAAWPSIEWRKPDTAAQEHQP
jgi:hypothetical protein